MNDFKNLKYKYKQLDAFGKIIVINVIIFVVSILFGALLKINLGQYFALPSDINAFILQPWSIITYSFFHSGLFHILFNMLMLFYLAGVINNLFRAKMALNIYFLGVIFGGLAYLLVASFLKRLGLLLGASAGVSAMLLFVAVYLPSSSVRLFGAFTVSWRQITIFFVAFHTLGLFVGMNVGGNIAHLGGYLLGFLYAKQLQKGNDIGLGFEGIVDSMVSWFKPKSRLKTVHRNSTKQSRQKPSKTSFSSNSAKQKHIDAILDKISKSGYDSLTKAEKEFLFKAGKE